VANLWREPPGPQYLLVVGIGTTPRKKRPTPDSRHKGSSGTFLIGDTPHRFRLRDEYGGSEEKTQKRTASLGAWTSHLDVKLTALKQIAGVLLTSRRGRLHSLDRVEMIRNWKVFSR
jgi:hypothetical protein